jgi:hypothetical protein
MTLHLAKVKQMTPTNWTFDHEDFDLAYDMVGSGPDRGVSTKNPQPLIALIRRLTTFFVPSRKKPGGVANATSRSQGSSRTSSGR